MRFVRTPVLRILYVIHVVQSLVYSDVCISGVWEMGVYEVLHVVVCMHMTYVDRMNTQLYAVYTMTCSNDRLSADQMGGTH
jgi:hypothetical protein